MNLWALTFFISCLSAQAMVPKQSLTEQLSAIRNRMNEVEKTLSSSGKVQSSSLQQLKRVRALIRLQKQEKEISLKRIKTLEEAVESLESRRAKLREKIDESKKSIRQTLKDIHQSQSEVPRSNAFYEKESIEAPRRKILSRLADKSFQEIETVKADLTDADYLEKRIFEERAQLVALINEADERESALSFNERYQADLVQKKGSEKAIQLENYQKLKVAEAEVEKLLKDFNVRMELRQAVAKDDAPISALQGQLDLPVFGQIVGFFGKSLDPSSKLHVFKKGIDIQAKPGSGVSAILPGKIAFSGEVPSLGKIAIIDHGNHFYSICGKMEKLIRKAGEVVKKGDSLGFTSQKGDPLYFELRTNNIPINPLQWIKKIERSS